MRPHAGGWTSDAWTTTPRHRKSLPRTRRYFSVPGYDRSALEDRKSTRLNSSHLVISYAVFCLKKQRIDDARVGLIGHPRERHRLGGRRRNQLGVRVVMPIAHAVHTAHVPQRRLGRHRALGGTL